MASALTGVPKIGSQYATYITGTSTLVANTYNVVIALLSGAATLNLPAVASCYDGYVLTIRNNSAAPQTLTVDGNGSENIGGATTAAVTQDQVLQICCDHTRGKWQILLGPV